MALVFIVVALLQVLELALRQQVGGGELDVAGVLQVRRVDDLDRLQILHILDRDWKKDRARVSSHGSDSDDLPLRRIVHRLGVDLGLRVDDLDVGHLKRSLLRFDHQLGFLHSGGLAHRLHCCLLHFRLHYGLRRLGVSPFTSCFTLN